MHRPLRNLADRQFDLLIVGGGAFGAAAAWDASLRGLSVAIVERGDFGGGASGHCFKMVHGGIRYLQHADLPRLRASSAERRAFLRIAPHLVNPLPIVMPTYGRGKNSKGFLGLGMKAYDLLSMGRDNGIEDPARRVEQTWLLGRDEIVQRFPELPREGLTGGAGFRDGQMYSPPRLVAAFALSAASRGAACANHVAATRLLFDGDRVVGARVQDAIGGDEFDVRAKTVLNAAGPWADYLIDGHSRLANRQRGNYSRDACFVIASRIAGDHALAVPGRTHDAGALVSRGARHMFLVPWREYTLVGVWHKIHRERPDDARVTEGELSSWIDEINWCYPGLDLGLDDVLMTNCGLVPFGDVDPRTGDLRFGKESIFVRHSQEHGISGLVSLIGIRYTMARRDAAMAIDMIQQELGQSVRRSSSDSTPLIGGDIRDFAQFQADAEAQRPQWLAPDVLTEWTRLYGTLMSEVLALGDGDPALRRLLPGTRTHLAQVVHGVRTEAALRLTDIVFGRTNLGTGSHPGRPALELAARTMATELGWSENRVGTEIADTERQLHWHNARPYPRPAAADERYQGIRA